MKAFSWSGNYIVWGSLELLTMGLKAWGMLCLAGIASAEAVGRSIAPATILLSIAVAIVIQLWVKLNELSALSALNDSERRALRAIVQPRVRAIVWLVIFFVLFIFLILLTTIFCAVGHAMAEPMLAGVGAGCGASLLLIAAVLVDLKEVADYRWEVELRDSERKRRDATRALLDTPGAGFEEDEHLQGYKRVINDH